MSVGNLRYKPEALFSLFRKFLQRISLPRLIHFFDFDLVLPQLMPVQAAWAGEGKTLWSCHHIRHLRTLEGMITTPRVKISYLFTSHDHIHHVRIQWEGHPVYSFSLTLRWLKRIALRDSGSRLVMSLTNSIFKWA